MKRITIVFLITLLTASFFACGEKKTNSSNTQANDSSQQTPLTPKPAIDITMLMQAALEGDLSTIEKAIENGFDVNTTDQDLHTVLMLAAYNGHSSIVKLLLKHNATPDMRDVKDRTALMYASTGDFNETVILLLEAGASINLIDNEEHFTALMFAAAEGQAEVVRTLLKHGADKTLLDIDGDSAYDFALNNKHTEVVEILK